MTILETTTSDSDARLVSERGDPQHTGFTLTRRWERIHASYTDTLATALNAVKTYTDPKADRKAYEGTFIQSSLDPKALASDAVNIEQTLTKVKATTDSADADIDEQIGDPAVSGYKMNRAWHYINPYSLDTAFPAINANESYVNPKGNGEKQTGKFIVSRVRSVEQTDRTYDIIQDMVKVKTITSDTSLTDPLIDRAKDILHPFGEGTGVGRDIIYRYPFLDPASDTKLMAIADTSFVAKMSQNDSFIHVARKSTLEADRTLQFWVLAQRKQRIAWGGRYATPDHVEDNYPGRDGTVRRKSWYGIDNDCYAGVKSRVEAAASADTGFSVLGFQVRDNDDGSDDWTQNTIRQFNDTRTDSRIINTHGTKHNAISRINSNFENYTSEPATPALQSNYKYEEVKLIKDNRGLLSKRVFTSKPTPSNTVSSGLVDSYSLSNVRGADHTDMSGIGVFKQRLHDQVAVGSLDSVMRTMDQTNDTRFIVADIGSRDIGHGAAQVDQTRKRINLNASWFVEEFSAANNGGLQSLRRTWPLVLDTKGAALIDSSGAAISSVQYNGDSYVHIRAHRTKHYDGTSTVWQFASVSSSLVSSGGGGGAIWVGGNSDSRLGYRYVDEANLETKEITYQKTFGLWADAIAFADAGKTFLTSRGELRMGAVKLQGSGKWVATRVVRG
jgi:hypothetical protein